jgi:hypothetical protein
MNFKNWLETDLGDELFKNRGIWMIPFKDVQKDNIEGYYFDWGKHQKGGSISDLSKVNVGDKVADYSLNWTPYWTVSGVDEEKNWIYLNPIEPNPLLTGVGAGGKPINQHDIDVLSGTHETNRVNDILAKWKSGKAHNKSDVAYLLLGTVPSNFGPNGAQGGWYNSNDLHSNRGGQRGMSTSEIQKKDAEVLKNQFKFDIPTKALKGELDPGIWNDFVNGGHSREEDIDHTKLETEDFNNPQIMVKIILNHSEPSIKLRNVNKLMDAYHNYSKYRKDVKLLYNKYNYSNEKMSPELDLLEKKWKNGEYTNENILNLIHSTGLKLSKIFVEKQDENYDPYWHVKEKFIVFAGQQGWKDVLEAYDKTSDRDNRNRVFDYYEKLGDERKMMEMLGRETTSENIHKFLQGLFKKDMAAIYKYVEKHYDELLMKIENAIDKQWYAKPAKEFLETIRSYKKWGKL